MGVNVDVDTVVLVLALSLEPRAPATWNLRLCCTVPTVYELPLSAGNTRAMPSADSLGEARRDNAMASRASFAAAKEQDERDERDDEGGGTRSVVMTILLGADTLQH